MAFPRISRSNWNQHAFISCVAKADKTVRAGCVSTPHSWGTNPDEKEDPLGAGGNTGRLSYNDRDFDKRTGIPLMSAIPIRVRAKPAEVELEAAE